MVLDIPASAAVQLVPASQASGDQEVAQVTQACDNVAAGQERVRLSQACDESVRQLKMFMRQRDRLRRKPQQRLKSYSLCNARRQRSRKYQLLAECTANEDKLFAHVEKWGSLEEDAQIFTEAEAESESETEAETEAEITNQNKN